MATIHAEHTAEAEEPGLEPAPSATSGVPWRTLIVGAIATLVLAVLTGIVFLMRAGGIDYLNWPVQWELLNSDTGVLYELSQDVFAGRPLDWNFSGQVYIFPEIPISLTAYVLGAGSVYRYFLFIAIINNCITFLLVFGVLRLRAPLSTLRDTLTRSALASVPLLLIPLIGTPWLGFYQLGATYYVGMYFVIFGAPLLFLARSRVARVIIATAIMLTVASNPLAIVFTVPAFLVVLLVKAVRDGIRSIARPALFVGAILVVAVIVRLLFLQGLQGKSLTNYMDYGAFFSQSIPELKWYFGAISPDPRTSWLLIIGVLAFAVASVFGVVIALRYRKHGVPGVSRLSTIYYALVPITGLIGTAILAITHYLYVWPILIAPIIFLLAAIPRRVAYGLLALATIAAVFVAVSSGGVANLKTPTNYFGYRAPDTLCLDQLPKSQTLGYSTFSDARRIAQTSKHGTRLIAVGADGVPNTWLANDATSKTEFGTFYVISQSAAEPPIDIAGLEKMFGAPDGTIQCSSGSSYIAYYTDPVKQKAIETFYRQLAAG